MSGQIGLGGELDGPRLTRRPGADRVDVGRTAFVVPCAQRTAVFFVMQRIVRTTSVCCAALFGCISLFGPGWHHFVGHQFHASSHCHASCDDHAEASHEHGATSHHGATVAAFDNHDCPLCRFFAQAQWAVELGSAEREWTLIGSTVIVPRSFWIEPLGSYRSRAPPAGAPI